MRMTLLFSLNLLATVFLSCTSSKYNRLDSFAYLIQNDSNYALVYLATDTNVANLNDCKFYLSCNQRQIPLYLRQIGSENNEKSNLPAYLLINKDESLGTNTCKSLEFNCKGDRISFPLKIFESNSKFFCNVKFTILPDQSVMFSMDAVRLKPQEEEYFPTSERIRVIVRNQKGKVLWRSDEGIAFLQVIGEVQPKEIFDCYRYSYVWDGKDSEGRFILDQKLNIELILPIYPNPIIKFIEYGGNDGR